MNTANPPNFRHGKASLSQATNVQNKKSLPKPKTTATPTSKVEDEYIRNLQQQIYLLELETRYLRSPHQGSRNQQQNESNDDYNVNMANLSSAPLNDTLKTLKYKYIELQESHKKDVKALQDEVNHLKSEQKFQQLTMENLERERDEMAENHHTTEKDKLYGEALQIKKKLSTTQGDLSRLEIQYARINTEKNKLQTGYSNLKDEVEKHKSQIEEQLMINEKLKEQVDRLRKVNQELENQVEEYCSSYATYDMAENERKTEEMRKQMIDLKSQIQTAQAQKDQEEYLKMKISQDNSDLIKVNVGIKAELFEVQNRLKQEFEKRDMKIKLKQGQVKEFESTKEELARLKDDYSMAKISLESKQQKLNEAKNQSKSVEAALTKALETQRVLEDRILDLENRARADENELIQLGQDKSLLIDDIAELRNTSELNANKNSMLLKEKQALQTELAKYQKEMSARKEFVNMVQELETSGENYLGLMRNVKGFLNVAKE